MKICIVVTDIFMSYLFLPKVLCNIVVIIRDSIATNPPMRILGNEQVTYHVVDLQNSVDAIIAQIFS